QDQTVWRGRMKDGSHALRFGIKPTESAPALLARREMGKDCVHRADARGFRRYVQPDLEEDLGQADRAGVSSLAAAIRPRQHPDPAEACAESRVVGHDWRLCWRQTECQPDVVCIDELRTTLLNVVALRTTHR